METVYPDYYNTFHCIADKCRHTCCIGWEIDIDEKTAANYRSVKGIWGRQLSEHIAWEDLPHFILDEGGRCPFLNDNNLCDLILNLGEERLCSICREHPRFRNELPDRVEMGLGLCCEEAARLILGQKGTTKWIVEGTRKEPDAILLLRDAVLSILQNREDPLTNRIAAMMHVCGSECLPFNVILWRDRLMSLERMDERWTNYLMLLTEDIVSSFSFSFIVRPEEEYEHLMVYLIYRYFANAWDREEAIVRACFAAFGCWLIHALNVALFQRNGYVSFEDQVELCRLFSAEIEYSEENRDMVLNWLSEDIKISVST